MKRPVAILLAVLGTSAAGYILPGGAILRPRHRSLLSDYPAFRIGCTRGDNGWYFPPLKSAWVPIGSRMEQSTRICAGAGGGLTCTTSTRAHRAVRRFFAHVKRELATSASERAPTNRKDV